MAGFKESVYKIVQKIPRGRVSTYAMVAKAAGSPGAAQAVGNAMRENKKPFYKPGKNRVPCHRVVKSDGTLGGFSGGIRKKIELLRSEGVKVVKGKIVDFNEIVFSW